MIWYLEFHPSTPPEKTLKGRTVKRNKQTKKAKPIKK